MNDVEHYKQGFVNGSVDGYKRGLEEGYWNGYTHSHKEEEAEWPKLGSYIFWYSFLGCSTALLIVGFTIYIVTL